MTCHSYSESHCTSHTILFFLEKNGILHLWRLDFIYFSNVLLTKLLNDTSYLLIIYKLFSFPLTIFHVIFSVWTSFYIIIPTSKLKITFRVIFVSNYAKLYTIGFVFIHQKKKLYTIGIGWSFFFWQGIGCSYSNLFILIYISSNYDICTSYLSNLILFIWLILTN